jgi:hypothetical protein
MISKDKIKKKGMGKERKKHEDRGRIPKKRYPFQLMSRGESKKH